MLHTSGKPYKTAKKCKKFRHAEKLWKKTRRDGVSRLKNTRLGCKLL
jgi:hypothetical protein